MHPCSSTTSANKRLSVKADLAMCWCFWVMHEHNFQVAAKSEFQLMREDGRFT